VSVEGAAGLAELRDARSDSYARFSAAGPVFVVRARCLKIERDPWPGLLIVRSRMLSRVVWGQVGPAASSTDVVHGQV